MQVRSHRWTYGIALAVLLASNASATSVPSLTFEELTDHSEVIIAGQVIRSWSDWDSEHKFIWTHHEVSVSSAQKGAPGSSVIVSEPGGIVGNQGMTIAGSVTYRAGEQVAVFLRRMPNGYLRTTGMGQGKYTIDRAGRLHGQALLGGLEIVAASSAGGGVTARGASLRTLDGITLTELRSRIAARVGSRPAGSVK